MIRPEPAEVLVLGATCLDVKARPLAPLAPGSYNPARIQLSPGGSGRSIAENLARLGVRVALLSVVGDDMVGRGLLEQTARAGVDVSRVIRSPDHATGTNLAIFTQDNQRSHALDDVSQLKAATPEYLHAHRDLFRHARMLITDGTPDTDTVSTALAMARRHGVAAYLDPASVRRAYALRPYLSEFTVVSPNAFEAEALLDVTIRGPDDALEAARRMVASRVEIAIVTLGEEGLVYVTSEGPSQAHGRIPAVRCDVVDRTGVGDALTAAIAYGLLNGMPVDECMRLGIAAATLTLRSPESVSPEMSLEQLYANMVV